MNNCKKELLTALVAAIKLALPTFIVRTKINDFDTSNDSAYPYIYISDIYQTEIGPKRYYAYELEVLIQVVYKDATSLVPMYSTQDSVLGIFTKPAPFTLTGGFTVQETELLSSTDTEVKIETGTLNIGLIRVKFTIHE